MPTFYTYLWLRYDGIPYYVGKGHGDRAFRKGSPPVEQVLVQEFLSEENAFLAEKFLIALYGRKDLGEGILINHTDGGEGPAGRKHSEEAKEKNRLAHLGFHHSEEAKAKIGAASKGNKYAFGSTHCRGIVSEETRAKLSIARKGKPSSRRGFVMSDEQKQKISVAKKGRSPAWNKGVACSDETKQKIGAANKAACVSDEQRLQRSLSGRKGAEARWGKVAI